MIRLGLIFDRRCTRRWRPANLAHRANLATLGHRGSYPLPTCLEYGSTPLLETLEWGVSARAATSEPCTHVLELRGAGDREIGEAAATVTVGTAERCERLDMSLTSAFGLRIISKVVTVGLSEAQAPRRHRDLQPHTHAGQRATRAGELLHSRPHQAGG